MKDKNLKNYIGKKILAGDVELDTIKRVVFRDVCWSRQKEFVIIGEKNSWRGTRKEGVDFENGWRIE